MPLFVVDAMGSMPGLPGIFVSGIFAASLSSVSAAMNSLAAVTLEDYIKPLYLAIRKKPMMESNSALPSKITAFLYGLVCIGVAFLGTDAPFACLYQIFNYLILFSAQYLGGILQISLSIFGSVGGPLFGMFTLGMFTLKGNQRVNKTNIFFKNNFTDVFNINFQGAITGLVVALVILLWMTFGQPRPIPPTLDFSDKDCPVNSLVAFSSLKSNATQPTE